MNVGSQEAGKLLLHPDPILFNGQKLVLSEESFEPTAPSAKPSGKPATIPPDAGGLFIPRSAATRPRAGLGSKKMRTTVTSVVAPSPGASGADPNAAASGPSANKKVQPAKGQDDFRRMLGGA